jgi:hypothetical protein
MSCRVELRLAARQPHARWVARMNEAVRHHTVPGKSASYGG